MDRIKILFNSIFIFKDETKMSDVSELMENDKHIWDKIGAKMVKKAQEEDVFYNSNKFKGLTTIMKNEGVICQEDFKYNKNSINGLTYDDFTKVCNSVYAKNMNDVKFNKKNGLYELNFNGLKISLLVGQGSSYITEKID